MRGAGSQVVEVGNEGSEIEQEERDNLSLGGSKERREKIFVQK